MDDTGSRQRITAIMWVGIAAFMITVVLNGPLFNEQWMVMVLTLVPLVLGFFVTLALWSPAVFPWVSVSQLRAMQRDRVDERPGRDEKPKRSSASSASGPEARARLLLDLMDDHEREQFKQDLKRRALEDAVVGEDGEISYGGVALDDLLDEDLNAPDNQSASQL
jgi:hypothetical protein